MTASLTRVLLPFDIPAHHVQGSAPGAGREVRAWPQPLRSPVVALQFRVLLPQSPGGDAFRLLTGFETATLGGRFTRGAGQHRFLKLECPALSAL